MSDEADRDLAELIAYAQREVDVLGDHRQPNLSALLELQAARAEVARLRAALADIDGEAGSRMSRCVFPTVALVSIQRIAQAALDPVADEPTAADHEGEDGAAIEAAGSLSEATREMRRYTDGDDHDS